MWARRWRPPHGPHLPSCPHLRNSLEGRVEHASCPAQQRTTAVSSLMCWTVRVLESPQKGLSGPLPSPSWVPSDLSLCPLDLVEKKPCSRNSSRVCECRAGMFCGTSVVNSCARCIPHSVCPAGLVVKLQGEYPHRPGPRSVLMPPHHTPTSHLLLPAGQMTSPVMMTPRIHPGPLWSLPCTSGPRLRKSSRHCPGWRRSWVGLRLGAEILWYLISKKETWSFCPGVSQKIRAGFSVLVHGCALLLPLPGLRTCCSPFLGHPSFPVHPVNSTLPSAVCPDITSWPLTDHVSFPTWVWTLASVSVWSARVSLSPSIFVRARTMPRTFTVISPRGICSSEMSVDWCDREIRAGNGRVEFKSGWIRPGHSEPSVDGSSEACYLQAGEVHVCMLSHFSPVRLCATLWTIASQAPLSMGFFRQEYWSEELFPSPGDLPSPEIEPASLSCVFCNGN